MRILFTALFAFSFCSGLFAQNLIGMDEKDIKVYMKENKRGFNLQNDNNTAFNYLKYANDNETETILFFLSDKSICTEERIICDLTIMKQKLEELDKSYQKDTGKTNSWTEKKGNNTYLVDLKEEKWYFSINIKKKE